MGSRFGSTGGVAVSPATTVTGPDAYGAAAAVGTAAKYAREDHNHGLPAAPAASLTTASGVLGADVPLAAATTTWILNTASLAVGTWLVACSAEIVNGGTTAGDVAIRLVANTVTATFGGPNYSEGELPAINGGPQSFAFTVIVTVTGAGSFLISALSAVAATVKALGTQFGGGNVTGYTAVKIG